MGYEGSFTTADYQQFCTLVQEIEDENQSDFVDRVSDIFLNLGFLFGIFDNSCKKEIIDKNNYSKQKIAEIFEEISALDNQTAGNTGVGLWREEFQKMAVQASMLAGTADAVSYHAKAILAGTFFEGRDFKSVFGFSYSDQSYAANVIGDVANLIEDLRVKLQEMGLTDDQIADILEIVMAAPEPYRSLYLEHVEEYVYQYVNGDGAYWDVNEKDINIGRQNSIDNDERGAYNTLFHETGHGIDDLETKDSRKNSMTTTKYVYEGRTLHDIIVDDVRDNVTAYIRQTYPDLNESNVSRILAALNLSDSSSYEYEGRDLDNGYIQGIIDEIQDHYSEELWGGDNMPASDVYGGVTNNAICGQYGHYTETYWYNKGQATGNQEAELWAEFFAAKMTNNEAQLECIREHFPQAYEAMEQLAKDLAAN